MDVGFRSGGQRRRPVWAALVLALALLISFCLGALSLWHVLALKHEVAELRSEVAWRRTQQQPGEPGDAQAARGDEAVSVSQLLSKPTVLVPGVNEKAAPLAQTSSGTMGEGSVLQPCLQMMPDRRRSAVRQEHTTISWQVGLRRGSALVEHQNTILVREEGFYFVYSQTVTLFRCIQTMNPVFPYNTCYTAGIAKLEAGDSVELLIPRQSANISLDGDSTFFGALRLL
ncbi:tumor necrosis factor ligand superfamily member 13B-like isoform X4 [Scleropages formosus]|uniref:tumor necrosis factor ligand superfamily member 13B-like isoform X4 n=1 Tax=Scleropages formosus TaxID=113540 RepID=UPI0010FAC057|nr:tumor necrosis factor ligand superfamily member 13B isoform X4 [Scleropages formosus]